MQGLDVSRPNAAGLASSLSPGVVPAAREQSNTWGSTWDALQEEEAAALVEGLLDNDALSLLVHRLNAFNESVPEEAAAVYNVLTIFENIIEVKPDVAELVLEKTKVRCQAWLEVDTRLHARE